MGKGVKALIIILVIAVIGLSVYIVLDKTVLNKDTKKDSQNLTTDNASNNQIVEDNGKVAKIDPNRPYIYDADYEKNVKAESYSVGPSTYYASDLVVPYININSNDATVANTEIQEALATVINHYNDGIDDGLSYVKMCEYTYYIDEDTDNVLSVVVTYGLGATDVVNPEFLTYTFDLKTGSLLSYSDVYTLLNYTDSSIKAAVENTIKKESENELARAIDDWENYANMTISAYNQTVQNNTIKYFISLNRNMGVIVDMNMPAGSGHINTLLEVESSNQTQTTEPTATTTEPTTSSDLTDHKNGEVAFQKVVDNKALQTEQHGDYYTYTDSFANSFNIKEIIGCTCNDNGILSNDGTTALFEVIVTFLDNTGDTKIDNFAVTLNKDGEAACLGTYISYTGSTNFVRTFTDLYNDGTTNNQ